MISNPTQAAKEIKKELKAKFPKTKFSVRSDSYSQGSSVDIYWNDGPTTEEVNKIVGKYQYGHFDGMVDSYEYSNKREDLPQAKYVMAQRTMTDKTREKIMEELGIKEEERNAWNESSNCWNDQAIYRKFCQMDLKGVTSE